MYANRRNFSVLYEIGVEEHDGDVRFLTGSGNTAVSRMHNSSRYISFVLLLFFVFICMYVFLCYHLFGE